MDPVPRRRCVVLLCHAAGWEALCDGTPARATLVDVPPSGVAPVSAAEVASGQGAAASNGRKRARNSEHKPSMAGAVSRQQRTNTGNLLPIIASRGPDAITIIELDRTGLGARDWL